MIVPIRFFVSQPSFGQSIPFLNFMFFIVENARVMVLAATNRPSELDEAILRRLPQAFEIGMPDRKERAQILKVILKGETVEENIDFDYLASLCEGYTGSDLLEVCKQAAYFPIRELLDEERKGKPAAVRICSFFCFPIFSSFSLLFVDFVKV